MQQRTKLIVYIIFMTLIISGSLFFGSKANRGDCPICKHSLVAEGMMNHSTISKIK